MCVYNSPVGECINRMCRCGDVFDPLPTSGRAQVKVKEAVLCLGKRALGGVPTYGDYGRFDAMERGVRGGLIYTGQWAGFG